jgi:hypothetical protein
MFGEAYEESKRSKHGARESTEAPAHLPLKLLHPRLSANEAVLILYVINYNSGLSSAIVHGSQAMVSFLSSGILKRVEKLANRCPNEGFPSGTHPYFEFNSCVVNVNGLGEKGGTYCALLILVELSFYEPQHQR